MLRVVADDGAGAELTLGLDEICREGARRMLAAALEAEADAYVESGLPPLGRTPLYAASWLSQDSSNSWGDAYPRELWSRSLLYHMTHSNIASRASSFVAK